MHVFPAYQPSMIEFISRQFISSRYWLDIRTWRRIYLAQRVPNNRRIYWWLLHHPTILPRTHVLVGKVNRIPGPASPTMIHTMSICQGVISSVFVVRLDNDSSLCLIKNTIWVFLLHFILCTQNAMILPHFNYTWYSIGTRSFGWWDVGHLFFSSLARSRGC